MLNKIIPCFCLWLTAIGLTNAQVNIPASYSAAHLATTRAEPVNSTSGQIHLYLAPTSEADLGAEAFISGEIKNSVRRLEAQKIRRKSPHKAIQLIRHEVESKYLRHYQGLSDFSSVFKQSRYNEITAAALISILLRELGIDHKLYLFRQEARIDLADGSSLAIETWGHSRPGTPNLEEEQSCLIAVLHALQVPPESPFYQSILLPYRSAAEKRLLLPAELTGMLYYRRALDFYARHQLPAAVAAVERARTYFNDPKLDLVRYAILFQQAGDTGPDSTLVAPLFELYRVHPSREISLELVRRFAQLAEHYLLEKVDSYSFEQLYTDYRILFAAKKTVLQQLKEIYFIEMAQFYARKYEPQRVIAYLDSLNTYRPDDLQIQQILTPLLVRALSNQKDPEKGLHLIATYRKDFPFLQNDQLFKDMELRYRAEHTRQSFDADREAQARTYLEDFEQYLAQAGLTPRYKLWITTAYYSASSYYFRNADYPNARWFIQRALALIPDDQFLLHRQEVLRNY